MAFPKTYEIILMDLKCNDKCSLVSDTWREEEKAMCK